MLAACQRPLQKPVDQLHHKAVVARCNDTHLAFAKSIKHPCRAGIGGLHTCFLPLLQTRQLTEVQHILDWLQAVDRVYANRVYLQSASKEVLMSYMWLMFGMPPDAGLPTKLAFQEA